MWYVDPTQNGLRKANKEALVIILRQLMNFGCLHDFIRFYLDKLQARVQTPDTDALEAQLATCFGISIEEVRVAGRIAAAATRRQVGDPAILADVIEKIHEREAKRQPIREAISRSHSSAHDTGGGVDPAVLASTDEPRGGSVAHSRSAAPTEACDDASASVVDAARAPAGRSGRQ